jgi:K+-transporting ATPase KdpC subunit
MKTIITACLYTVVTAVLLGIGYPLAITAIAQLTMHDKANGQLIVQNGETIGSAIIGQPFTGPGYFHSRPSSAGTGYDASSSSGSNYATTNKVLIDRVAASVKSESNGVCQCNDPPPSRLIHRSTLPKQSRRDESYAHVLRSESSEVKIAGLWKIAKCTCQLLHWLAAATALRPCST